MHRTPFFLSTLFCIVHVLSLSHSTNLQSTIDVTDSFYFNLKGSEANELYEIRANLTALSNNIIHVASIPVHFGFIIVQVHGYLHEISLAFPSNFTRENFIIKGTNVGLVEYRPGQAYFELANPNPLSVYVMMTVIGYSKTTPVPGGCNMVFNVEVAPYLELRYNESIIEVTSQPALSTTVTNSCNRNSLQYEIYHMYQLERDFSVESYFRSLKNMMTVNGIRTHGRKVAAPLLGTNQKKRYSAYPGTGSLYAIIVSEVQLGVTKSAAYVPIHTYACSTNHLNDSCFALNSTLSKTVAVTVFCLGVLLCSHGHVSVNTETYLMGSLMGGFYVAYATRDAVNVVRPMISGLGLGVLWLLIWSCCCSTHISRIITYSMCGAVISSFALFGGLGDLPLLQNDTNYWLLFSSLILLSVVILYIGNHRTSAFACSIIGAYMTVIPIDHYVGSNLKYAFINVLRRAVVKNFNLATIDPPFQFRDIMIIVLFFLVIIIGYKCQMHKIKKRPDFESGNQISRDFDYSFVESTPIYPNEDDEPHPHLYPWFAGASPGSDNVFESPRRSSLLPHPSQHPSLRFIPAPLRCNPILKNKSFVKSTPPPSYGPTPPPELTNTSSINIISNSRNPPVDTFHPTAPTLQPTPTSSAQSTPSVPSPTPSIKIETTTDHHNLEKNTGPSPWRNTPPPSYDSLD